MIFETIANTPEILLILLVALTLISAVIGYCVALIFAKRAARKAIEASRLEMALERRSADRDQHTANIGSARLHSVLHGETDALLSNIEREKELESQLKLRIEQVQTLEVQIETLEDKQLRLSRDFASYKSSKNKELELARNTLGQWEDAANLPTLSRKMDHDSDSTNVGQPSSEPGLRSPENINTMNFALSRDIDIPVLEESEIPDVVDDLDLDVSNAPGSGARGRG